MVSAEVTCLSSGEAASAESESFAVSINSESLDTSSFKIGKTLSTRSCFLPETFKPFSLKMYFSSGTVYFSDISSAVNVSLLEFL